jgi:hypothetical protein
MPFLPSGNVTFVRFRPDLAKPRSFDESHLVRLDEHRAGRSDRLPDAENVGGGWAGGAHLLDTAFDLEKNVYPDHLVWDFRIDTNKPPPDLLKAYIAVELKALCRHNPSGLPSAKQKREAKEAARERIEQEGKDGRFLKRKCHPVLWDATRNELFLGATSANVAARFMRLFTQTFGDTRRGELTPVTAGELALRLHPQVENETPSEFVRGQGTDVAWIADEANRDFLGNEFLLWLWYYADAISDTIQLPDATEAAFMFSGGVKVDDPAGRSGYGTLNSDSAPRLPEARTAVRHGKLPRKAALTVVRQGEQFSFILQAETLAVTSAKLPPPGDDVSGRGIAEHRLQAVRNLAETVEQMYAAFLARRMAAGWADELDGMRAWLSRGRVAA